MSRIYRNLGTVAMEPKGEYNSSTYYEKLNMVNYEGVTYVAKEAVQGEAPSSSTKWQKLMYGSAIIFDNVAEMKDAASLEIGMTVETSGYYSVNDGGRAKYAIRTKTQSDVEDNGSIHFIGQTLVAELIIENNTINLKQFGAKGDNTTDNTTAIQNAINYIYDKDLQLMINRGTYKISHLEISRSCNIVGESKYYSCLKSIDNNNSSYLLKIENNGLFYCNVSNFSINGNKENNSNPIDGLLLYTSILGIADRYSDINNLYIYDCTGNGVLIDGAYTDYDVRGVKLDHLCIMQNNKNGLYVKSCTDSIFINIESSFNLMNGFIIGSSSNKLLSCKSFWNGRGYEEEVDISRTPESGFTPTSDTTYNPSKTYYTRSGNNIQNNWYVFTEFTGDTFDSGTTYYENTTPYYKRYSGYKINGSKNILTNCDAQDNFGDGFAINGVSIILDGIGADDNGLYIPKGLPFSNENITNYESDGRTQNYYGVYINSSTRIELIGYFDNFRYSSKGAMQKGPVYIVSSSNLSGDIVCNNQVTDEIISQNSYEPSITIKSNGKNYEFNLDLSSLSLGNNLTFNTSSNNQSFVKRVDGIVYYKLILKDSNNTILPNSDQRILLQLPYYLRPQKNTFPIAKLSSNNGYEVNNFIGGLIGTDGNVSIKSGNYESFSNLSGVVLEGSFIATI